MPPRGGRKSGETLAGSGQSEAVGQAERQPIELRIQHVSQLFHTLDPYPFRERDLDVGVEDYVVGWARELRRKDPLEIRVRMPVEQARGEDARHVADAFGNYFSNRADVLGLELRALLRGGRDALAVGLVVLAFSIFTGGALMARLPAGFSRRFVEEGLIIVGWVANWKPIEIFLFEWWPIARRRALYRRLADARVTVMEEAATS